MPTSTCPAFERHNCIWAETSVPLTFQSLLESHTPPQSSHELFRRLHCTRQGPYPSDAQYQHALRYHYSPELVDAERAGYAYDQAQNLKTVMLECKPDAMDGVLDVGLSEEESEAAKSCQLVADFCGYVGGKLLQQDPLNEQEFSTLAALDSVTLDMMDEGQAARQVGFAAYMRSRAEGLRVASEWSRYEQASQNAGNAGGTSTADGSTANLRRLSSPRLKIAD